MCSSDLAYPLKIGVENTPLGNKAKGPVGLEAASSGTHPEAATPATKEKTRATSASPKPAKLRRVTFREYATEIPFAPWPSASPKPAKLRRVTFNLSEGGCQNVIAGGSSNVGAMHASLQQLATPAADAQERAALALSCGGKDPAPKVLCPAVHGMEAATLEDKDADQDAMKRELAGMKEDKAEVPGLDLDGGHDKQEEEEQMQKLGEPPHDAQAIGEGHRISDPAQLLTVCNDEKMLDDAATGESRKLLHASEPDGQDHVAHMPQLAGKNASQCSSEGSSRSDDRAASVSVMSAQAEAVPQEEAMALETGNDSPAEQYPAENEARAIGDTNIMYDLMY